MTLESVKRIRAARHNVITRVKVSLPARTGGRKETKRKWAFLIFS
jgi:hypothetical protein